MNLADYSYRFTEYPLSCNGINLFLECMTVDQIVPERSILLVHGATHASLVFDVNYEDYSLARKLVREGFAVWRLDIAGYGRSGDVPDGFLPRMDYAAEDIHAAVTLIRQEIGHDSVDLLGWSWGTVTTGRFAVKYPELVHKLVLYAPFLTGIGHREITEEFFPITWESMTEDFQCTDDGEIDSTIVDPGLVKLWCATCRRYNKSQSPNACRLDFFVHHSQKLIDLDAINAPTLVICGDKDPYLDYRHIRSSLNHLPEGSELEVIPGGSHIVMYEKPYYRDFQDKLIRFLCKE